MFRTPIRRIASSYSRASHLVSDFCQARGAKTTSVSLSLAQASKLKHGTTRSSSNPIPVPFLRRIRTRPFSSCLLTSQQLQHDSDSELDGQNTIANEQFCHAAIINDGNAVAIHFPNRGNEPAESSILHAPWLWSQCPSAVLPSSGQRIRSPGQYPNWKIKDVAIVQKDSYNGDEDAFALSCGRESYGPSVLPIPAPPSGSCHPILGNNLFLGVEGSSTDQNQTLLKITWDKARSKSKEISSSQRVSYYDIEWLRQWQYDSMSLHRRRQQSEITTEGSIPNTRHNTESGLVEFDYKDIVGTLANNTAKDGGLFTLFDALFRDGAALITNAPAIESGPSAPVATIGKALGGSLSHGALYGDIFHVKSEPSALNIAYTSLPCCPHQDLAYYESPPGIQMLHCVATSPTLVGGESILVDCMAAAENLRRMSPEYFRTLVTCPATFVKQRAGACMTYLRPHIVLKEGPDMNDIAREIVAVNWSPPFEGPLCIESDQVIAYYKAYAAFQYMLDNTMPTPDADDDHLLSKEEISRFASYAHENTWEWSLMPGEMLVFSNKRLVHGRRGFHEEKRDAKDSHVNGDKRVPIRHLIGGYTNVDDTLCRYRVLLQEGNKESQICYLRNIGNGTSLVP